jgi:Domain of unknown function (DUF4249)
MRTRIIFLLFSLTIATGVWIACRDPYNPPVIQQPNAFLVVDGFINTTPGDTSYVTLSRTRNLNDSAQFTPETRAVVAVETESGQRFTLRERGRGVYYLPPQSFIAGKQYRLDIRTSSGSEYASAFVEAKTTPPIDSVTWRKDGDVNIYVFTHDPNNNTRYYRWDYTETWEYDAFYDSNIGWDNNNFKLYYLDSSQLTFQCFRQARSADIAIATTANLAQDIVDSQRIAVVAKGTEKIAYRYSIEVSQFGLTKDAFEYWQLLKKNSNQLGTLFDPQPSQITGNLTCLTRPTEPVIGFISFSSVAKKRLFIRGAEVAPWGYPSDERTCAAHIIPPDSAVYYLQDGSYSPAYYVTGGYLAVAPQHCVDCRTKGGTTTKPSFW